MNKKLLIALFSYATWTNPLNMVVQELQISKQQKQIQLDLALEHSEKILKQTLSVSVDNPHATLGQISINPGATQQYLPEFCNSKEHNAAHANLD